MNGDFWRTVTLALAAVLLGVVLVTARAPGPAPLGPQDPFTASEFLYLAEPEGAAAPGTGRYHIGIVPTRWSFEYDDPHHFGAHEAFPFNVRVGFEWVEWETFVRWRDRNGTDADDGYDWYMQHTVLGMRDAFMDVGHHRNLSGSWGYDEATRSYRSDALKGFDTATVVLAGWRLEFHDPSQDPATADRHIRLMGLVLSDVVYDREAGRLDWKVAAHLSDQNGDDRFLWGYRYLVIAFNEGEAVGASIRASLDGNRTLSGRVDAPAGSPARQHAVVLPQGWLYQPDPTILDFEGNDSEVRTHRFHLRPVSFDGNMIRFDADMKFPDGAPRLVDLSVVALFFDDGGSALHPPESEWAPGGWPARHWRELGFRYVYDGDFPLP
jgi:hypothetical protein